MAPLPLRLECRKSVAKRLFLAWRSATLDALDPNGDRHSLSLTCLSNQPAWVRPFRSSSSLEKENWHLAKNLARPGRHGWDRPGTMPGCDMLKQLRAAFQLCVGGQRKTAL